MTYLIIGRGKCARHFDHYFNLLNIPHFLWNRSESEEQLESLAAQADRILLLIRDSAIGEFYDAHPFLAAKKVIHFSGALTHAEIFGVHPLMTFGPHLYDLETYKNIPFVCEKPGRDPVAYSFSDLLPGLPNTHYIIPREKKPYYHAMCTMSGNFTTILWESTFQNIERQLELPRKAFMPFLERTFLNLHESNEVAVSAAQDEPASVLTGPLQRRDTKTLIRHLDALRDQPEQSLYLAFLNYFFSRNKSEQPSDWSNTRSLL